MSGVLQKMILAFVLASMFTQKSAAEFEQWCIADEQSTDEELLAAQNWACGPGGADCSKIQLNQPCHNPDTLRDHASYAFNSYFQKNKHKGGSCYFRGSALITELDPSHDSCQYEYIP